MPALHHLAFRVGDLDLMHAFYARWFGFEIVRDLRPRSLWLSLGAGAVLMLEMRGADEPSIDACGMELVAFAIDVEARVLLHAQLVASDLLEGETEHTLYFRDPEGRRVAVSSYPW